MTDPASVRDARDRYLQATRVCPGHLYRNGERCSRECVSAWRAYCAAAAAQARRDAMEARRR